MPAGPTRDGAGPAIELLGLRKRFPGKEVLSGLDLAVERGTVFGYVGPNGAGKTTTVKILTGQLGLYQGEARVAGIDVAAEPREVRRRVGYVPEAAALYEGLSGLEFLELVGRVHGLDEERIAHRASALLEAFELESYAHARLGAYSKGMRQKVLISAALLHDPEVLFLDEPLSGLDVASTIFIKTLVRALADRGRTIFYCSHMMDVVERVCDRIVVLHEGRVAADGSFEELARRTEDASLEAVFRRLTGAGGGEERVERLLASLEEDGAA